MATGPKFLRALAADFKKLRPADDELVALEVWTHMVRTTCDHLAVVNPRFDYTRFFTAAGVIEA